MTHVMGLDLSLAGTGVCLPSGQLTTIRTDAKTGDKRLTLIRRALTYYVTATGPDVAVIEAVPPSMRGGVATIVRLALVHGVAREVLADHDVPFVYLATTQLKKYATGSGSADKQQMIDAAFDCGAEPSDSDQADAFWCRAAAVHHYSRKPPTPLHALSLDVISGPRVKVKWPALDGRTIRPGRMR